MLTNSILAAKGATGQVFHFFFFFYSYAGELHRLCQGAET